MRGPSHGRLPRRAGRAALALAGAALAVLAGCGGSVIPQIRSEPERMQVAKQLLARGDEAAAISLFKGYIDRNTGASDIDAAIYLLGEAYLAQKEWTSAQLEFERVVRDYPESDSSGSASFRLGDALHGQARGPDFDTEYMQRAFSQWMQYRAAFPGHWRQPEADERIRRVRDQLARKLLANARLYTKLRRVEPARVYYLRVLTEYGDLGLAGEAEIGLALCDRLEGKKAEAIERLQRIEREHSGTPAAAVARKERERTEKMKVKVAKPAKRQIPDVTTPAGGPGAGR